MKLYLDFGDLAAHCSDAELASHKQDFNNLVKDGYNVTLDDYISAQIASHA